LIQRRPPLLDGSLFWVSVSGFFTVITSIGRLPNFYDNNLSGVPKGYTGLRDPWLVFFLVRHAIDLLRGLRGGQKGPSFFPGYICFVELLKSMWPSG